MRREAQPQRVDLWEGHGRCGRLSHGHRALCLHRARLVGRVIASGSDLLLAGHPGYVVGFSIGCAARCLRGFALCRGLGRLALRAGRHARGDDRVIFRCQTWCRVCCVEHYVWAQSNYLGRAARADAK